MISTIYDKGDISPRICDDVLDVIMHTDKIKGTTHKIFAYCYLGLISYLDINKKYSQYNIKVQDIKRCLGYAENNKKINYIIKKNGVLENLGFINDQDNPFQGSVKNRIKVPTILDEMKDCHTFNLKLFFRCMEEADLKLTGFFVSNYIKEFQSDYIYGVRGSVNYMSKVLNISKSTVSNYLERLAKYDLINKNNIRNQDNLTGISMYFRNKINNWKDESLSAHNYKCFITGERKDLIVHHIVPFNKIRDYALNQLDIDNKSIEDFTDEEIKIAEGIILDFHKLSIGVPLSNKVHEEFHREYGNYATIEDLLEYKYNYNK